MIYRKCRVCGYPMDPGEGRNGICDDCVNKASLHPYGEKELDMMLSATVWEQMKMEDFINVGSATLQRR